MTSGHASSLAEQVSRTVHLDAQAIGPAETTTMLSDLIVSRLCPLILLHIACNVWPNALEIDSAADNLDTGWLGSSPPKCCHVW
jgi:hypothetical protein